jgi:hypothetical protein
MGLALTLRMAFPRPLPFKRWIASLALVAAFAGTAQADTASCTGSLFASLTHPSEFSARFETIEWTADNRKRAVDIMVVGSLNVSRTKVVGRRFIAPPSIKDGEIAEIAERNFRKAADYMFDHLDELEINLATAAAFNRILTTDLVPKNDWGQFDYRTGGPYVNQTDPFVKGRPQNLYAWLESPAAKDLAQHDPVALAEIVHNSIAALDSFPDGNGRLSRLFADFVLIKRGMAPAFYTDMKRYFDVGNARSPVSRAVRQDYFREIVERGQRALRGEIPLGWYPRSVALPLAA